jgi:hypothetical protein
VFFRLPQRCCDDSSDLGNSKASGTKHTFCSARKSRFDCSTSITLLYCCRVCCNVENAQQGSWVRKGRAVLVQGVLLV